MKKLFVYVSLASFASLALAGCSGLMNSTKDKSVNMEIGLYGMEVQASDATANGSPAGKLGFGSVDYHSAPMGQGQPYYAKRTTNSMWSSRPASETEVWVGRAAEPSILTFEAVPGSMIKIAGDGTVTSGAATVTITPSAAVDSGTTADSSMGRSEP